MRYLWNGGPVVDRELGRPAKLWFLSWNEGVTLARDADGVWRELRFEVDADLSAYSFVLRGGYRRIIPSVYRDELVAAGYGAYIVELDEYTDTYLYEFED